MKKVIIRAAVFSAVVASAGPLVHSEDTPQSAPLLSIEQRLSILEQKHAEGSTIVTGPEGFQIKSNDGNFVLRFSGLVQVDYRDYLNDHGSTQFQDQFLLRRVRPTFQGTVNKTVGFLITPEFASGGTTSTSSSLSYAYVEFLSFPWAKIRVGKFKPPVGLEQLQSDSTAAMVEKAFPDQLTVSRDTGVQASHDWRKGQLVIQAAVFNGAPDGARSESDTHDGKDYVGRIFIQPFKPFPSEWINGWGAGVGASIGDQFGSASSANLTSGYRTDGQQAFFTYQSGTFADGERKRVAPQTYWYTSHVGLLAEYIASSQEVRRVSTSTQTATLTHRAWQIAGSIVLTGERPSFNGVKPRKAFDPKNGGWGALECAGRYSVFRADDESFDRGFSSIASSARKAKAWAAGLNWYPTNNLRVSSDYAVTSFTGGAAGGLNRPTEKVILSRVQLSY